MTFVFRRLLPIAAALLCAAAPCHAQGNDPQPKPDPHGTYETDPAVDPARPTVTNPAHIPPPGYLQFEQGFLQGNGTPGGPDSQFSLVQSTKLAVNHRLMAIFASQPFARTVQAGAHSRDVGDLDLGGQVVLVDASEGHSHVPTLAFIYLNRIRAGSAASLDVGSWSRSLTFAASGDIPGGFHYDTNLIANEQQADSPHLPGHIAPRRAQWGQTLSVTHNLTSKLSLSGEIWRLSQPLTPGNAIGNLWALGYTANKRVVFDFGFNRGLTSTSTAWEGFGGVSFLIPHRLWHQRPRPGA